MIWAKEALNEITIGTEPFWKVLFLPKILSGCKLLKMVKTHILLIGCVSPDVLPWRSTTLPWAPQIEIACTPINKTESLCAQSRKVAEVKMGTKKNRQILPPIQKACVLFHKLSGMEPPVDAECSKLYALLQHGKQTKPPWNPLQRSWTPATGQWMVRSTIMSREILHVQCVEVPRK